MPEVVEGLQTTSDKIRDLLREGYLRTEIAEYLDVRYQRVRNVAVNSGIDGGTTRGIVVLPKPKPLKKIRVDVAIKVLAEAGFEYHGTWLATDAGIGLSVPAPKVHGVYAFVIAGFVKYVGLTKTTFQRRFYSYQRPGVRQRTSLRLNAMIGELLAGGAVVEIYLATPPALEWNGLPVHTAAGLEAGLIEMIQPPWNKMGVTAE